MMTVSREHHRYTDYRNLQISKYLVWPRMAVTPQPWNTGLFDRDTLTRERVALEALFSGIAFTSFLPATNNSSQVSSPHNFHNHDQHFHRHVICTSSWRLTSSWASVINKSWALSCVCVLHLTHSHDHRRAIPTHISLPRFKPEAWRSLHFSSFYGRHRTEHLSAVRCRPRPGKASA